jgi:hypothetical protein
MNDKSYRITFLSRANLYCFLFLAFPTLLKNEILQQQLWGYKVEWRSVSRGRGGGKVEYHWIRSLKLQILLVNSTCIFPVCNSFQNHKGRNQDIAQSV